jgi:drug/metabolite transporter (DMT)-like permease
LGTAALVVLYALGGASGANLEGILWLLVAAVSWGVLGIIGGQAVERHDPFLITGWASVVGAIGTLALLPLELSTASIGAITPEIVLGMVYLGVVSTAVAFALWVYGVAKAGSVLSGIAFFAQPLVGSLLGAVLLGENLGLGFGVAAAMLFVAAMLSRPESTRDERTLESRA